MPFSDACPAASPDRDVYAVGALVLGLAQLALAIQFAEPDERQRARALLRVDHLPAAAVAADVRGARVTVDQLPPLNATLNATSAVLLLTSAWWLIKQRRIEAHRR